MARRDWRAEPESRSSLSYRARAQWVLDAAMKKSAMLREVCNRKV